MVCSVFSTTADVMPADAGSFLTLPLSSVAGTTALGALPPSSSTKSKASMAPAQLQDSLLSI